MATEQNNEKLFETICDFPIPSYEEWKQVVEKSLKGAPFSKLLTKTYEELILEPMYQQKDIANLPFVKTLPGEFPFVRGTEQGEGDWLVAQEMNHPIPETLNEWLKNDLGKGVNVIHLVLNELHLSEKYSSDTSGVVISSLEDLATILKDIDVEKYPFIVQGGASSTTLVGFIAAHFRNHQLSLQNIKGCIGADPLAVLIKRGTLTSDIESYLDQMGELLKWTRENSPNLQTIFIDGHPYHDGGGNAVQELAFMLGTAVYYIRELQQRGLSIDEIAPSIRFSISIGSNLFMELAKIRTARLLWANIIEAFGGNEQSQKLIVHARTSRWTKTVYDPYVNILRSTVEAFTAAVGGVNSLHISPFDEANSLADNFSRRIARNIHFIIKEEAQVNRTCDPAGGSWYVEHITSELANNSWKLFQKIEENGGMYTAIVNGLPQQLVKEVAIKKTSDIEKRKLVFVGATMYANSSEQLKEKDNELINELIEKRMQAMEKNRKENFSFSLKNVVEDVIETATKGGTLEEITEALTKGNGLKVENIETFRATEAFESLRFYSEKQKQAGHPISVFLTSIGSLSEHKPRTDFISNFFETGGFEVLKNNGYENIEEAINSTVNTSANTAVLCGKNESYNEYAVRIIEEVKKKRPEMKVFVAGKQDRQLEEQLEAVGVDGFIHIGTNCYSLLLELQGEKEVSRNE